MSPDKGKYYAVCVWCERSFKLNRNHKVRKHTNRNTGKTCMGSGSDGVPTVAVPGSVLP